VPGGTLTWAEGQYHSLSGLITTAWKKEGDRFTYSITVPANTTATVHMPSGNGGTVLIDGVPADETAEARLVAREDGYVIMQMQAGQFTLTSEL
jgi:alpha-L-rhamnosidase